jgi:ribosome biogenesis GTPase
MKTHGRIIEEQKNYYLVNTIQGTVRATRKGALKKENARICTGDLVDVEITNNDTLEGIIEKVGKRSSFLPRPPIANIDQLILVCTVKEPPLDREAIDRFLLSAGAYNLKPVMLFNKSDLIAPEEYPDFSAAIEVYKKIGYETAVSSAVDATGLQELLACCAGKVSAFAGLSGVGKSTLLSRLFPDREFRTSEVSGMNSRGTHTTTIVTLLPLPGGGFIADTPGLSFVNLPLIPEEDVAAYFPELERLIGTCKFNNCIHENEPGCKVREMVETGEIEAWRVEHYLKIYREMQERRRQYRGNKK